MNVALIGNQNSGKTSLFNKLTGMNQKVGNWPGVTVAKKEGVINGTDITIVDLPGVYSLMPYTSEENISREYLLENNPDVVVNIIDSTSLERSLYLTTQLLDLGVRVVVALNMSDLLEKKSISLDEKILSEKLGVSAIKTSAKTGLGISELIDAIKLAKTQKSVKNVEIYSKIIKNELDFAKNIGLARNNFDAMEKILGLNDAGKTEKLNHSREVLKQIYKDELEGVFAGERYRFISSVRDKCLNKKFKKETISDRLDKIFLNKYLALPIFVLVMSLVYFLSVGFIGKLFNGIIENFFELIKMKLDNFLIKLGAAKWSRSLVTDGMLSGLGAVLSFIPELVMMFVCISILETTGYMSRISFMFDRLFRKFGLSGKSLVPFIVGTGCSVPAISSSRTIENDDEKEMTIMLSPFVPCSAKLPIIVLFASEFFPNFRGLVSIAFYFLSVVIIVLCATILKKFIYKNKNTSYIAELPEYKKPNVKYVIRDVFDKTKDFIVRAGTIILFCSIIIWFLSSFGWNLRFCENIENSILAGIGNVCAWFFYPMLGTWNWAASISAIQGLIAKEQVVSSLSIIAGISGGAGETIFSSPVLSFFNKANAFSFVMFNLFSAPCVAAIGAMKSELKSTKKVCFAVMFQIATAWILATLSFLIGSLILK